MLYVKNVPTWERIVRLAVAAISGATVPFLSSPWSYVVAIGAASLIVTAFIGYCPMCAMIDTRRT